MDGTTPTTARVTELSYQLLDGKISTGQLDAVIKRYENNAYSRMEIKSLSVSDFKVLTEQRRANEINDSTWILGILGYKKSLESNGFTTPYTLPEINPNDVTLAGPQKVASLYKTGEIPLHTASSYINEYRASWEASLPSNVLPLKTRNVHDIEKALNGFKDGTTSWSTMLKELKAFITPETEVGEVEADPSTEPVLYQGDKVRLTEEGKRKVKGKLSELDEYYTVLGGSKVGSYNKEETRSEEEDENAGIMLLADEPDTSYGGYAPPNASNAAATPVKGDVVVGDSYGNNAGIALHDAANTVSSPRVVNTTYETSGQLNMADLPINSVVSIQNQLTAGAHDVINGTSNIGQLVSQASTLLHDETIAAAQAGTYKGQINTTTNVSYEGTENAIKTDEGYTTLPGQADWTSGPSVGTAYTVGGGNKLSNGASPWGGGSGASMDDLIAMAKQLNSGNSSVNIAQLIQMAQGMGLGGGSNWAGDTSIGPRQDDSALSHHLGVDNEMPITSPSSIADKNMEGGTQYKRGGSYSNDSLPYKPDDTRLVMGTIRYHPTHRISAEMNYVDTGGTNPNLAYNRKVMLNQIPSLVQNNHGYPFQKGKRPFNISDTEFNKKSHLHERKDFNPGGEKLYDNEMSTKYEYMTDPRNDIGSTFNHEQSADERPSIFNKSFKEQMANIRAQIGIPVHGDNDLAVAMKYFMYNRFRMPDSNLAFNRSVPHIFFSRPDLNMLQKVGNGTRLRPALRNNAEVTMMYRQRPEMFKLLTDRERCGDNDNFNYLLSNQVVELHAPDEEIELQDAGKSWGGYSMPYGGVFTGRNAGKLEITFNETQYGDVTKMLKLWMIYIDNVSRGVWSPSYNIYNGDDTVTTNFYNSHVYTRTLDYPAAIYVFRLGPDGDEIIYWTKYYGVFPINGGTSSLASFNGNQDISSAITVTATFSYAWKKDMSPMSLLEFNTCACITNSSDPRNEGSFNCLTQRGGTPFVTKPFVYFDSTSNVVIPGSNQAMLGQKRMRLNLRFQKSFEDMGLKENMLYSSIV